MIDNKKNKDLIYIVTDSLSIFAKCFIKRILPNFIALTYPLILYILTGGIANYQLKNIDEETLKKNFQKLKELYKYQISEIKPFSYIFKEICSEICRRTGNTEDISDNNQKFICYLKSNKMQV